MKKVMGILLVLGFLAVNSYAEVAENKKFVKKNVPQGKANGFWKKEGERSGVSAWGPSIKQTAHNLNPVRFFQDQETRYNARKAGSVAK